MKKICYIVITIVVLVLVSCLIIYYIIPKKNLELKMSDDKFIGIIFIGGLKDSYDYTVVKENIGQTNFETILVGGEERYLIIPNNCNVEIYSLDMSTNYEITETFIKKLNTSFYINCNASDIFPNCVLKVKKDGKVYEYSPYISLKDGSVYLEDFVQYVK